MEKLPSNLALKLLKPGQKSSDIISEANSATESTKPEEVSCTFLKVALLLSGRMLLKLLLITLMLIFGGFPAILWPMLLLDHAPSSWLMRSILIVVYIFLAFLTIYPMMYVAAEIAV